MERLTDTYWRNLDPWECCGQDHYCQRGCHDEGGCTKGCIVPKLYGRLAAYEDIGLTPKEIVAMKNAFMGRELAKITEFDGIPIDRLKELALAEREWRLAQLPPNDPLTLEELREMDGEPVYLQFGDGTEVFAIVGVYEDYIALYSPDLDEYERYFPNLDFINMEHDDPAGHFGLHVRGWRAYRRKPEEGTT